MSYAYTFNWVVYDRQTKTIASSRSDGHLEDKTTKALIKTFDVNGLEVPLRTDSAGILAEFYADATSAHAVFGETRSLVISDYALDAKAEALAAAADAAATRAAVERIAETATEVAYFYRDGAGDIYVSDTPVMVGGGVPRLDSNGDPVVVFSTGL